MLRRLSRKHNIDRPNVKSYQPIFNLSVLSKLLRRLVYNQLITYVRANNLLSYLQSALRAHHSKEMATLKAMSDILFALVSGNLAVLSLVS